MLVLGLNIQGLVKSGEKCKLCLNLELTVKMSIRTQNLGLSRTGVNIRVLGATHSDPSPFTFPILCNSTTIFFSISLFSYLKEFVSSSRLINLEKTTLQVPCNIDAIRFRRVEGFEPKIEVWRTLLYTQY